MKKIKILGTTYKIKRVNLLDDGASMGECDRKNKIVRIAKNIPEGEFFRTLTHEICHARLHEALVSPLLSDDLEEIIIEHIIETVFKLISDFCENFSGSEKK